jgi:hypothetical protein
MDQDVKSVNPAPFTGDFGADIGIAKQLLAKHPKVNLRRLLAIADDAQQPESARVAAIYTLGYTDDHGVSKTILVRLAHDQTVSEPIRDHAAEALASITPHHLD